MDESSRSSSSAGETAAALERALRPAAGCAAPARGALGAPLPRELRRSQPWASKESRMVTDLKCPWGCLGKGVTVPGPLAVPQSGRFCDQAVTPAARGQRQGLVRTCCGGQRYPHRADWGHCDPVPAPSVLSCWTGLSGKL